MADALGDAGPEVLRCSLRFSCEKSRDEVAHWHMRRPVDLVAYLNAATNIWTIVNRTEVNKRLEDLLS